MTPGKRIDAVDAARGSAMVLVCLSHVKQHFQESAPLLYLLVTSITLIATPTFLLLSGFVNGYLLRRDPQHGIAITLLDRGLFLLLVAHVLLGLEDLARVSVFEWLFVRASITDAIGVALWTAVLLRAASAGMLLTLGASVCALSWFIGMTLAVQSEWASYLSVALFHVRSAASSLVGVPLLAYIAVFILGMALSAHSYGALVTGDERTIAQRLLLIGSGAIVVTLIGAVSWHTFKYALPEAMQEPHLTNLLRAMLNPRIKRPPSPAYLLFYGGIGLLMTGLFILRWPARLLHPIIERTSVFGRSSLMCFVVQDWLLFVTPALFGFSEVSSPAFWLAYFALCVLILYALAGAWDRARGNRFLTVGLKWLARQRQNKRRAIAPPSLSGTSAPTQR